jgi:hypothetical protein
MDWISLFCFVLLPTDIYFGIVGSPWSFSSEQLTLLSFCVLAASATPLRCAGFDAYNWEWSVNIIDIPVSKVAAPKALGQFIDYNFDVIMNFVSYFISRFGWIAYVPLYPKLYSESLIKSSYSVNLSGNSSPTSFSISSSDEARLCCYSSGSESRMKF